MAYGGFKDLLRRAACDKILRDKASDIAKSSKGDRYHRGLVSVVYINILIKSPPVVLSKMKIFLTSN